LNEAWAKVTAGTGSHDRFHNVKSLANSAAMQQHCDHTDATNVTWQPSMLGTDGLVSTMESGL